jgi:hypothetical protein
MKNTITSKHNILPPYSAGHSMTRSGMSFDPQAGYNIKLCSNWERPNYSCNTLFIQAGFSSHDEANKVATELNNKIIPLLDEIVDVYHNHYVEDGMGDSRVIIWLTDDGRIGWSFSNKLDKGGEFVTRGDVVSLSDGRTTATVIFVLDDRHLINKLKNLGRH